MSSDIIEFKKLFPQSHIPIILSAFFTASDGLQKKSQTDLENRITTRLLARLIRTPPFRDGPLDIRTQSDLISSDDDRIDDDTPAGGLDFIVSCGAGYHVYFAIEAKRLRVRSETGQLDAGNDKYVNAGMMRFVTGQYAPLMETGAMLGYVFDGQLDKAQAGVSGYIQKKQRKLKLKHPKSLEKSDILQDDSVFETLHDLTERQFTIYHLFIAV